MVKEKSGDEAEGDCPICLQALPVNCFRVGERYRHVCCGHMICASCHAQCDSHRASLSRTAETAPQYEVRFEAMQALLATLRCPMCRAPMPKTEKESFLLLRSRVLQHDHWGWAHLTIGQYYEHGTGCNMNTQQAVVHYYKAIERDDIPEAQYALGNMLLFGQGVAKSVSDAACCFKSAAARGYPRAQYMLGKILQKENSQSPEAVRLYRVAAEQGLDLAQCALAYCLEYGQGIRPSLEESSEWNKKAADQGNATAMGNYAVNLLNIATKKYGGLEELRAAVGYNVLPEALHWLRKALAEKDSSIDAEGRDRITKLVDYIEAGIAGHCGNCRQSGSVKLSKCAHCRAVYYCNRTCQRDHWGAGHRLDCCNKQGLKVARLGS